MRGSFWWIDRWRKSTAYTDMTLTEQGAYRNILDELWLRDGAIPDDERTLARASGDPLEWPAIRAKVMAHFHLTPEGWRNETHDEVAGASRLQAEKGRKRAADAERSGGRFTSRTPAESPAENQPAAGGRLEGGWTSRKPSTVGQESTGSTKSSESTLLSPAEPAGHQPDNQPHPPADDQPPYTVHRSPYPYTGTTVPSLRSGGLLPTHTPSVEASVQAPVSPLVEVVAAANPDAAWSRDACDAWVERFKGRPPGGQIGRALKPLVQKHGWGAVRPAWRTYLAFSQPEYASAARFAMTYGEWAARAGRPLPL